MSTADSGGSTDLGPTEIDVAYADTSAAQLGFSLEAPEQPALAECSADFDGITISLRLLGASHQVIVDDGHQRLCETVACLPEMTSALPESYQGSSYYFASHVDVVEADALADLVDDLGTRVADRRADGLPALLGRFPGEPHAVTAIISDADAETISWHTWHTYPQAGEVVVTTSVIQRGAVVQA
ncbi:hypothetical protein Gbro_0704 [Gordonia bronchialis DSM 43247]|uniref:DUF2617 domain-containing protein n=1 Tax=Gordonia bronchialis (strain ATCC 25592 / DSM 43247 / BCRC 13721 / JCM 3198 / KCTC 3076 / NBRC 16047 / NCTC 10667) TaxID=526226 RepID=D0L2Q1_GORB4|nr:DUF2617 family protein [Gordonia bronchialis]ACY20026.1 hypothetical protein Gbro_0704 [Gordonia bronchialis DSM 43247]MCC3322798.1 DUF2617 family protein [Gordonia bronchialis]QGS26122.1 DUF2617 family protein [Gordonia bronchialis]UAK37492.1 DUF2617 family protein [Gordonia bronchialis]STQ62811.1 Protein of uncharacterised function DUF2617 [Gordonia bronchialis]